MELSWPASGQFFAYFMGRITHEAGFFVELTPVLKNVAWGGIPGYKLAQHFSTAFGLAALGIYMLRMERKSEIPAHASLWKFWSIVALACVLGYTALWLFIPNQGLRHSIGNKIVWLHTAGLFSLLLAGLGRMRYVS